LLAWLEPEDGDLASCPRPVVGVSGENLLSKPKQPFIFIWVGDLGCLKFLAAERAVGMRFQVVIPLRVFGEPCNTKCVD
jgi:hypothetical protein